MQFGKKISRESESIIKLKMQKNFYNSTDQCDRIVTNEYFLAYHFRVCTSWERGSPRSDWPERRSSSWAADTCRAASVRARRCHWWDPDNFAGTPRRRCPPAWRRSKVSARSEVEILNRPPAAQRTVYRETLPRGLSAGCSIPARRKERQSKFDIRGELAILPSCRYRFRGKRPQPTISISISFIDFAILSVYTYQFYHIPGLHRFASTCPRIAPTVINTRLHARVFFSTIVPRTCK